MVLFLTLSALVGVESRAWAQSPQVDLQVSGISFTSTPSVGVPTVAVAQLANLGSSSSGGFNVKWFLDGALVGYGSHVSLAAGEVSNGNVRFSWMPTAGAHSLQFVADVDGHVQESNESNNAAQVTVGSGTPLRNNMVITTNVVAAPGTYAFQDPEEDGALIVGADNITIDLNGATLDGGSFQGYAIRNNGHSNVSIINGTIRGYRAGILLQNASGNRIQNNTLSGNRNRPARHDARDFLGVWGEWAEIIALDQIGNGIVLRDADHTLIHGNSMTGQQNGVGLFNSNANTISNNDVSNNEGWGIHLHRSSDNTIQENLANNMYDRESTYCHAVQQDGCDTAALLIIKGSHRNRVTRNQLKNSGDGLFLAGFYEGSDDNVFTGNDGSAAKHLAFEATFADGNVFEGNTATGAGRAGFWLGGSTNTIVRNNTITGNGWAGIVNEGTREILIEGNLIADNRGGGIGIMPLGGHPASAGYQLRLNRIQRNLGYGIRIEDALESSVFDGDVIEDNEAGIRVGPVPALSAQVASGTFGCTGGCPYGAVNLQLRPSSDYYLCQPQCVANCSACEQISYGGIFSSFSSSLGMNQAQFQFSYTGSTTGYHVDLSTRADMSWDVYLDFATGAASPVVTPNPQRWTAYTCGRTLYWRVWDQERRVSSPIQTSPTFACPGTFSSP